MHADFGGGGAYGIPFRVVPRTQRRQNTRFVDYADESDPGPYPIPLNRPESAGSDRHVLVLQRGTYACSRCSTPGARALLGGLQRGGVQPAPNRLRTEGHTSADAAGLPILPGLARYDEVRCAAAQPRPALHGVAPSAATFHHYWHFAASSTDPDLPPMGLRLPRASYPLARFRGQSRVILRALKRYGMIVADNGTSSTSPAPRTAAGTTTTSTSLKTVPGARSRSSGRGGFGARAGQRPAHAHAPLHGHRPSSPSVTRARIVRIAEEPRPQRRPGDHSHERPARVASGEATVDVEERAGGAGRARGGEVDAQPVGDAAAAAGQPVAEAEAEQHARAGRALAAPAAPQRGQRASAKRIGA